MKDLIQLPCELLDFRTYATKQTVRISFETQEALDTEHLAQLLQHKGKTGWLVFSPSEQQVRLDDIPDEPVNEPNVKTPSQRLRSVLWVYYKSLERQEPFDTFYTNYVERVIDAIKEKLPPQA